MPASRPRLYFPRRSVSVRGRHLGLGDGHPLPPGLGASPTRKPALDDFKPGPLGTLVGGVLKAGVDLVASVFQSLAPGHGDQDDGGSGAGSGGSGAGHDSPPKSPRPTSSPGAYPSPAGGGESAAPGPSSTMRPPAHAPSGNWPIQSPATSASDLSQSDPAATAWPSPAGVMNVGAGPTGTPADAVAQTSPSHPTSQTTAYNLWSGTASSTQSPMPPSNHSQSTGSNAGSGKEPHRFPLAAAGAIGAVLSFLVVSAIIWGFWFHLRRRRRARAFGVVRPKRGVSMAESMFTILSASTVPHFITAAEAGVKERQVGNANPFAHPADGLESEEDPFDDDFDARSLRRASTQRTTSTLSI